MRDDECHASLGPRRVLLVVRLHPRDPRPRPDDEFSAVYDDPQEKQCSPEPGPGKVNSPGTRLITTRDSS